MSSRESDGAEPWPHEHYGIVTLTGRQNRLQGDIALGIVGSISEHDFEAQMLRFEALADRIRRISFAHPILARSGSSDLGEFDSDLVSR